MLRHHDIERVETPSRELFERRFVAREEPVVISGAIEHWPARAHWTASGLRDRVGTKFTRFKASATHRHPDFSASTPAQMFGTESARFGEFLERLGSPGAHHYLLTGEEEWLFRRRTGQPDRHTEKLVELLKDFEPPPLFDAARAYSTWFWLSGKGVRTWLHYDNNGCHNLNALVRGHKRVWLFPPETLPKAYPFGLGHPIPAYNCSQVDIEMPDAARFPGFENLDCWTAELREGDLLFIPVNWLHSFLHTGGFNVNVNFWWKPERLRHSVVAARQSFLDAIAQMGGPQALSANALEVLGEVERKLLAGFLP